MCHKLLGYLGYFLEMGVFSSLVSAAFEQARLLNNTGVVDGSFGLQ